jgi:hypothetical protein
VNQTTDNVTDERLTQEMRHQQREILRLQRSTLLQLQRDTLSLQRNWWQPWVIVPLIFFVAAPVFVWVESLIVRGLSH